jgi:hypothetical protein
MDTEIINGTKIYSTSLQFPYQAKPSKADFSFWKDCLHRCFCKYITPADSTRAEIHLAHRISHPTHFSMDPKSGDYYDILRAIKGQRTLDDKFNNLPCRFRDIIGDISIPWDEGESLISALNNGTAVSASDGSYLEDVNRGSHAYKLTATGNDDGCIQGASLSPMSDKMSSPPTEHYGAIAVIVVLIVLLYHYSEDGYGWPKLLLYIDNQEVVDRGSTRNPNFLNIGQYLTHDFDLWMLLGHLQTHLSLRIEFEWIRGHQIPTEDMESNIGILLNNDVDELATKQYTKKGASPQRGVFLAGTVCYHQSGHHVQNISNAISSRETDKDILDYYQSKGWGLEALENVEWLTLGKFLKRRHPIERCKIVQAMHDWQNTGYQKRKFLQESAPSGSCLLPTDKQTECLLRCGHLETPFHYMQCFSTILSDARILGIEQLEKSLYKMKTSPPLLEAILQGILCWETSTEYDLTAESHPLLFDIPHQ